ncbi:MAG: DNA-directed RNA polymerase subunit H [Nanoarchaeota archaeon]
MTKNDQLIHILVPEHIKLSDKEKGELLEQYHVTLRELPKIKKEDPAIRHLELQEGDVVKIMRKSPTAGNSVFYRGVIDE